MSVPWEGKLEEKNSIPFLRKSKY